MFICNHDICMKVKVNNYIFRKLEVILWVSRHFVLFYTTINHYFTSILFQIKRNIDASAVSSMYIYRGVI
jgi:hypothetical protein